MPPHLLSPEKPEQEILEGKIKCTINECGKIFKIGEKKTEIKKHTNLYHTDQVYKLVLDTPEYKPASSCRQCPQHCFEGVKKKKKQKNKYLQLQNSVTC